MTVLKHRFPELLYGKQQPVVLLILGNHSRQSLKEHTGIGQHDIRCQTFESLVQFRLREAPDRGKNLVYILEMGIECSSVYIRGPYNVSNRDLLKRLLAHHDDERFTNEALGSQRASVFSLRSFLFLHSLPPLLFRLF